MQARCAFYTSMLTWLVVGTAQAQSGASEKTLEAESYASDTPMRRYRPTMLSFEAGLYGGAFLFSDNHNLQDLGITISEGHQELATE